MTEPKVRLEGIGYNPEWAAFFARAEIVQGTERLVYPVHFPAALTAEFARVAHGLVESALQMHRSGRTDLRLRRATLWTAPALAA